MPKEKSMHNKNAYFQNGQGKDNPNTPTPQKKKYKSEPALVNQPRFEEPLYKNYDLYETEGVKGPAKHGPGVGWHDMHKFKSIKEFLASKRKKLKDKYKADDSWVQDDGSLSKKPPENSKLKTRAFLFAKLTKLAIDFPIDDQVTPILGDQGTYSDSVQIGGYLDKYLPEDDFEGKSADKLNFGRDYTEEPKERNKKELNLGDVINKLIEKYHEPKEADLMGLPDGIEPKEDLDADKTVNDINPQYGTTDNGNTTYKNVSY